MPCAVCGCNNNNNNNFKAKKEKIFYFSFPTDPELLEKWVQFCKRKKGFNIKRARICSDHFTAEDFENNIQFEIGFINRPKLKPGSVPSVDIKADSADKSRNAIENNPISKDPFTLIKTPVQDTIDSVVSNISVPSTSNKPDDIAIRLEQGNLIINASTALTQGQEQESSQSSGSTRLSIISTESNTRASISNDLTTSTAVEEHDATSWSDFNTFDPSFRIKLNTNLRKAKGKVPKKVNFNFDNLTSSIESQDNCTTLPLVGPQPEVTVSKVQSSDDESENSITNDPTTWPVSQDSSTIPVSLEGADSKATFGDAERRNAFKEGIATTTTSSDSKEQETISSGHSNFSESSADIKRDTNVSKVKSRKSKNINSIAIYPTASPGVNEDINSSVTSMSSVVIVPNATTTSIKARKYEPTTSTAAQRQGTTSCSDFSTSESSIDSKQDAIVKKVKSGTIKKDNIEILNDPTTSKIVQDQETDSSSSWISASSTSSLSSIEIKPNAVTSKPQDTQVKDDPSTTTQDQDTSKSSDSSTNSLPSVGTETAEDIKRVKKRRVKRVNRSVAAEDQESSGNTSSEDTCVPPETRKRAEKSRKFTKCGISKKQIGEIKTSIAKLGEQNIELKKMQEMLQENIKTLQRQVKENPIFARPRKLKKRTT